MRHNFLRQLATVLFLIACIAVPGLCQTEPQFPETIAPADPPDRTEANCYNPEPMVSADQYTGPFRKLVAKFAEKPEIRTVHKHKGQSVCSLNWQEKFHIYVSDTIEPVSFVTAAFNAGIDHATDDQHSLGQGSAGYGKRFGVEMLDQATDGFFTTFFYPSIFHEDPRYYRLGHGSFGHRLFHATNHIFVAHRDSGQRMWNMSEWFGTASSVTVSSLYRPDNEITIGPVARSVGYGMLSDMGFDVLREFWPEVARGLHLPFIAPKHEPDGSWPNEKRDPQAAPSPPAEASPSSDQPSSTP